jgi:hypothetical protein
MAADAKDRSAEQSAALPANSRLGRMAEKNPSTKEWSYGAPRGSEESLIGRRDHTPKASSRLVRALVRLHTNKSR